MSRWFRHYAGMMRDDKLVRAALRAQQPIERVLWVWGAILESAAEIDDAGAYDLDAAEIAYFLRTDDADIRSILSALEEMGRVCEGAVVKWGDRQFQSDRSAERQKRHRDRRKQAGDNLPVNGNGHVTSPSRHADAPETETETDTKKQTPRAIALREPDDWPKDFREQFWAACPRKIGKGAAMRKLERIRKSGKVPFDLLLNAKKLYALSVKDNDPRFIKHPATWLEHGCWEDELPEAPTVFASALPPNLIHVMRESPDWEPHAARYRAIKGKDPPVDSRGGWTFRIDPPPEGREERVG